MYILAHMPSWVQGASLSCYQCDTSAANTKDIIVGNNLVSFICSQILKKKKKKKGSIWQ